MRARGLDGAWGGDPLFQALEYGDIHLVVTEVVPVDGGAPTTTTTVLVLFTI